MDNNSNDDRRICLQVSYKLNITQDQAQQYPSSCCKEYVLDEGSSLIGQSTHQNHRNYYKSLSGKIEEAQEYMGSALTFWKVATEGRESNLARETAADRDDEAESSGTEETTA